MNAQDYILIKWILIPPLVGFLLNLLFKKFISEKISAFTASFAILLSFLFSLISFYKLISLPETIYLKEVLYKWFLVGPVNVEIAFRFDNLSSIMALMVCGVSFLIHLYSIGYMSKDRDIKRFFSYMNLFVFFMLVLVLSDNPILMFVGWEGVGFCSYLLIGFWYENIENSIAGKKAFIANRIGDTGFILGLLLLISYLNMNNIFLFDFETIKNNISLLLPYNLGFPLLSIISLSFFFAATGKSAQFPLYVWLPDAMAGPTPVSALIHAATMVTAGVYMLCRFYYMFAISPYALDIVLYIATFTSLLSAIIATMQNDIKKILAYSTISQIGYMFMGVASGVYQTGFFHLITHAFFKALLFLSAGSVIHALSGEQNIFNMGGLKNKIKYTFLAMLIGYMAISAIPPFAGYFSKDLIIEEIYNSGHFYIWLTSVFIAALTAYYMTRLFKFTFLGKSNYKKEPHESSSIMLIPLFILAFFSIVSGFYVDKFMHFTLAEIHESLDIPFMVKHLPLFVSLIGILAGFYLTNENISAYLEKIFKPFCLLIRNKFYLDEIYQFSIINPLRWVSNNVLFNAIDRILIDRAMVEGSGSVLYKIGSFIRKSQNGNLQFYAFVFVISFTLTLMYLMAVIL
jgi:NADH-quinone oxidoreductase subunit L